MATVTVTASFALDCPLTCPGCGCSVAVLMSSGNCLGCDLGWHMEVDLEDELASEFWERADREYDLVFGC